MKSKTLIAFLLVAATGLLPRKANGQGCQGVFTPEFSVYATYAADSSNIYSTVTIDGYTQIHPSEYCPMTNAVHTPRAYNVLGSTGGWESGPGASPYAYVDFSNAQQIPAQLGVIYDNDYEGVEDCSVAGQFYDSGQNTQTCKLSLASKSCTVSQGEAELHCVFGVAGECCVTTGTTFQANAGCTTDQSIYWYTNGGKTENFISCCQFISVQMSGSDCTATSQAFCSTSQTP